MAVSGDAKLYIYNNALLRMSERSLASLTENREPRRVLDVFWGTDDKIVKYCLEKGDWNFAMRSVQLEPDSEIELAFGWTLAYPKPDDFRRLNALSPDERFSKESTLTDDQYADEAGFWMTDYDPLYSRYVSDDTDYGLDSAKWTENFSEYLAARLASMSVYKITNDKALRDRLKAEEGDALRAATSVDAMQEGVKFPPRGSWVRARSGRFGSRRDRSTSIPS